ncbi:F-box/kelch-repeat protein At3g06240-like [Spinacia oleracea]|uniref:F-box/kelch-repeat protein At3g06240-like n=1 Tax=Spinacia oleracea TaxID=3562 RepID=A0A9R0JLT3_SPIOL|nr:F-box/kelch-repeat protein At3g06240-like [Spinacia oleracea]
MRSRRRRNRKRKNNNCKVLPPELDLPPELWTDVLARLPAKTLVRFRCVCRAWCSKIDKPEFLSMHLSLYKNNVDKNRLLVMENSKGYSTLEVRQRDKYDEPRSYNIITHEIRRLRKSIPGLRSHFVDTYVESLALCSGREDQTFLY